MVKSCWICKTAGNKLNKSYFRIPKILLHRNPEVSELSALRKEKWRDMLLLPDDTSGIRICSDHFITGSPASLLDVNDPDWIPSRNLTQKTAKKLNTTLLLDGHKDNKKSCRFCFKLIDNELCVNIFQNVDKRTIGMLPIILGHKISVEGSSPYGCSSCVKKVRICARLLDFFRKNEKLFLESIRNDGMEFGEVNETCRNIKIQEIVRVNTDVAGVDAERARNHRESEGTETEVECDVPGEVNGIVGLYDREQIRTILEENSVSSEEGITEGGTKCNRRKYNVQSVNVRPIEVKTLKCNNCYRKFDDLDGLKSHKNFCRLFYCQLCKPQIIFREKYEQEKHKKKYHCHPLVCHICGKNYSQSYLVKHFKNHFEDRKKCPFCSKTLKNITILMNHLDNVHGNRFSTVCEVCGGNFKNLKKHLILCRKSGS